MAPHDPSLSAVSTQPGSNASGVTDSSSTEAQLLSNANNVELSVYLTLLDSLEQARSEADAHFHSFKTLVTRFKHMLENYASQVYDLSRSHLSLIDLSVDGVRKRVCELQSGRCMDNSQVDGSTWVLPPNAKTSACCVGLPSLAELSLQKYKAALSRQTLDSLVTTKSAKFASVLSGPRPVAPQVTGTIIPKQSLFPPPAGRSLSSSQQSSRGKSDPLLRGMLAASSASAKISLSGLECPGDSTTSSEHVVKTILTAGNWKKTLEVANAARSGDSVAFLSASPQYAAMVSERKRAAGEHLISTTSTGASLQDTGTSLSIIEDKVEGKGLTSMNSPSEQQQSLIERDIVTATGIPCFRELLRRSVMEDSPLNTCDLVRVFGANRLTQATELHGEASYAERLAASVFSPVKSQVRPCSRMPAEMYESEVESTEIPGEIMSSSLSKSPRPPHLITLKGRGEPLVRGLMTAELLKRANLLGRDDYLFFEWIPPSEQGEKRAYPFGAFRAEIIFNVADITTDASPFGQCDDRDEDVMEEGNNKSSYCQLPLSASSLKTTQNVLPPSTGLRLEPQYAQLVFETDTRPLEQCTRESCCKAFRQLMKWAEMRVTQLNLPSPFTVARSPVEQGSENAEGFNLGSDPDEWDGDFSRLTCHPLPQDYGRSELFDKRGSMRYIQLAASNPPVPINMLPVKEQARNFHAWYAVQFGNGMWKAEVIVDQVNSKRNSFQRSLKQMSYQRAQLQVMRWLFKKCRNLKIATFRYKGRKDEYLVTVPPLNNGTKLSEGYTLLDCPEKKRQSEEEWFEPHASSISHPTIMSCKRRRQ